MFLCSRWMRMPRDIDVRTAFGDTAKRQRLVHVIFNDRGDREIIFYVFITFRRSDDLSQGAHCAGVDGLFDRVADIGRTDIPVGRVVDFLAALVIIRLVHDCRRKCDLSLVKTRPVSERILKQDPGCWAADSARRTVQCTVAGLCPHVRLRWL